MARFPEHFIHQVAQATDIVELVGQYVALKKKGREFVGLCPFHEDRNPSMCVVPAKQMFHCFVCNTGGGVYQWLMKYDKLSFPEAVQTLAERANIPLPRESAPSPRAEGGVTRQDLLAVMKFAARFFRDQLQSPRGSAALEYARSRGLTDESIRRFGLGFAPDAWDALTTAAHSQGISQRQLVSAGLAAERDRSSGCYDRFRNRLIFPIIDPRDRVIAFGGRALDPEDRAKYLNSPDSILFDKSGEMYALNWARQAIVRTGTAVVAEGYLDALIPQQAGIDNIVATLGTSLTERHVRVLSRYAREAVLIFDADTAGQAAAERALELFLAQRLHVRVATIPSGKDPCDYVLSDGPEAMQRLVAEAPDALQYVWSRRFETVQQAGGNLAARRQAVEEFLALVVSGSAYGAIDEVRRGQLAQHIGHMLNIAPEDLQEQMRRVARRNSRRSGSAGGGQQATIGGGLAERQILEVLLNEPELFDSVVEKVDPEDFSDPRLRTIAEAVWRAGNDGRLSIDELLSDEALSSEAATLTELAVAGQKRGNHRETLDGAVQSLLYRRQRNELQDMKSAGLTDDDALRKLHRRLRDPDARRHPKIT